ncbi:unnamed protein product [Effrenium voratum]|nr:unnamed protein product [Effrenium voratum]
MTMPAQSDEGREHEGEDEAMAAAMRRCRRINYYLDLVPARFYLSTEVAAPKHQGKGKFAHLDPMAAKSTSQILRQTVQGAAEADEKKKKKKRRACSPSPSPERGGRSELVAKLNRRIEEMKEERRARQSFLDKAKAAEIRTDRDANGPTRRGLLFYLSPKTLAAMTGLIWGMK